MRAAILWSRVARGTDPDACWLWQGYHDHNGYGRIEYSQFTDQLTDWVEARTIVNGHDRASDIAGYAVAFCDAITHT